MTVRGHIMWLASYWKPHRRFLIFLFFFTLVSSAVTVAYPLLVGRVIDGVYKALAAAHPDNRLLYRLLGILGLVAFGRFVAGFYPGFRAWMNQKLEKDIRERVFHSLLEKDYTFFGKSRTGDLVTRLTDDIAEYPRIAWFGCSGIFRFVDSSSKFIFCVAMMLHLNTHLALLSMIPVPIMLFVLYQAQRALGTTYRRQQEALSRTNNQIEAAFSGIRIVKAFNAEAGQETRLGAILKERIGIQLKLAKLAVFVFSMDNIASRIGQVIVLTAGGFFVLSGKLSLGTLYIFFVYLDMLIHPMTDLPNLFVTARQAFVSIDREEEILRAPVVFARTGSQEAQQTIERFSLRGVAFRYREDVEPALNEISFEVARGARVALVGPVASGKSTLLRLLAGLLPAQQGSYAINGRPFETYDWPTLRQRIGYVPQESLLFSTTIAENVAFGRPADEPWMNHCLDVAQMTSEVAVMKDGAATELGQRGTLVSGGQKQRIAIARALAGRPDVLLLDDCTASLDARTEDLFWSALQASFPRLTVLLVSHRLATIQRADTILVLDRGRLVDSGTHEELGQRCAVYRDFLLTEEKRSHLNWPHATALEPEASNPA